MIAQKFSFALIGNPNAGKSSIFNQLTGLRQKTGNFPGVTVEKKTGLATLADYRQVSVMDLPGAYSLYPNSQDERIVLNILSNPQDPNYPDAVIYVADLTNLERHLLLLSQIKDLGLPLILALNMIDLAVEEGVFFDKKNLIKDLEVPVVGVNGRTGEGVEELKEWMFAQSIQKRDIAAQYSPFEKKAYFYSPTDAERKTIDKIRTVLPDADVPYRALLWAHHYDRLPFLTNFQKNTIKQAAESEKFEDLRLQITETLQRFDKIQPIIRGAIRKPKNESVTLTDHIDRIVTHHIYGPLIFFGILALIFQSIFSWAAIGKDAIEQAFIGLNVLLKNQLPRVWITDLITDGVLAGLSGVLQFIPQIAVLFFFIGLLEEVGYMARSVYLFDRIMQKFGMNGRSIVALVSGGACAIPAIMSTRTISNWKERLITIMVTPLISCSARIPVFVLLVGFIVPQKRVLGYFSFQGLVFGGLYVLSAVSALASAYVFKRILKTNESTFLMIELPDYKLPHWKNVWYNVLQKVRSFVTEAGKTIIVVSIILWFLASFGPPASMQRTIIASETAAKTENLSPRQTNDYIASKKLEASFAGRLGKFIEPAISPLGFDWKIGIALISSFAAREVFVGSIATIYSVGSDPDNTSSIQERMKKEIRPNGSPVYSLAASLSLMIFYVFALQCMSTIAVVHRETKSWKWPLIQFLYMGAMAYVGSYLVYHLFR